MRGREPSFAPFALGFTVALAGTMFLPWTVVGMPPLFFAVVRVHHAWLLLLPEPLSSIGPLERPLVPWSVLVVLVQLAVCTAVGWLTAAVAAWLSSRTASPSPDPPEHHP